MEPEWIVDWQKHENSGINMKLPGNTSTSRSIMTALTFANTLQQQTTPNKVSVLFIFLIQNHCGFRGFRLNDDKYSAYSHEQEYLLVEGFQVQILKIDKNIKIVNKTRGSGHYSSKVLTIFYLYNQET